MWRLRFRYAGRENMLSLGAYPDVSLKVARERCDDSRKLIANGVEPSDQHNRRGSSKTRFSKEDVTAHGFRALASTLLKKQDFPPDVIELHLATQNGTKCAPPSGSTSGARRCRHGPTTSTARDQARTWYLLKRPTEYETGIQ